MIVNNNIPTLVLAIHNLPVAQTWDFKDFWTMFMECFIE